MLRGFVTALRTLSVLPVPGRDADNNASALPWFPLVGCLLGLVVYGVSVLCGRLPGGPWPEGTAALLVLVGIVLTRGFHLDGLSDWADGFWASRNRDRILEIMKDSAVGTFGTLALIIVLMIKWVSLARLIASDRAVWIVAAYIVSRTIQVDLAATFSYARSGGGTAAGFVDGASFHHRAVSLVLAVILLAVVCGPTGIAVLVPAWLVGRALGMWSRKRIGGVTGDVLGAASELVETVILFVCASMGPTLPAAW